MRNITTLSKIIITLIVFISCQIPNSNINLENIPLIPLPKEVKSKNNSFRITKKVTLLIDKDNKKLIPVAERIKEHWKEIVGYDLKLVKNKSIFSPQIILKLSKNLENKSKEKYELAINKSKIIITASDYEGLYRGWNTLYQIIFFSNKKENIISI